MHMADALISPVVGGTMWAATAGMIGWSAKKLREEGDGRKVPLMGVLGAFVFASQMINFSIPGTGSSGHIGGGILLSIFLGPYAAFLTIASVLVVQALFFADGGILAMGCNIINMGFFPCFVAYPFIYQKIVGKKPLQGRIVTGAVLAAAIGLQMGAFSVVLETLASGISALPFGTFVLLMQPIHLAIGIVEGIATAAVVVFVWKARPEILAAAGKPDTKSNIRPVVVGLALAAALIGGGLSWFGSGDPDGLEWAMFKTSGQEELVAPRGIHTVLAALQEKTAFLPDYAFKTSEKDIAPLLSSWPAVDAGTSTAGLIGSTVTLALAGLIGFVLQRRNRPKIVRA